MPRKQTESTPASDQPVTDEQTPDRAPGEPAPGNVVLAVGYPHDSLTLEDGTEITADGSEVPEDRVNDIRAEAKAVGVTIRKVS